MTEAISTPETQEQFASKRVNQILENMYEGEEGLIGNEIVTGDLTSRAWTHALPMVASMITALEIGSKQKIEASSLNKIVDNQPFKDMEIIDIGFGSVNSASPAVTIFLPHLGARMYGVEPRAETIESVQYYLPDEDKDNLKAGSGKDVPAIFPGKQFDMVISNRVVEEWPMARTGALEEGISVAENILRNTRESLKEQGFSVHVTTMEFIVSQEELEHMGYEVVIRNGRFSEFGMGTYFFTILRKQPNKPE